VFILKGVKVVCLDTLLQGQLDAQTGYVIIHLYFMWNPPNRVRRSVAIAIISVPILLVLTGSMFGPFWESIFSRAFRFMPSRIGGNWTQVSLGIAIFVILQILRRFVLGWPEMQRRWKENIGLGVLAVALGWLGLFGYSIYLETEKINRDAGSIEPPKLPSTFRPVAPSTNLKSRRDVHRRSLYAVQIETVFVSQHPMSETEATGFWVAYISDSGKTLSPARIGVFLRITNLRKHPVMITRYSVTMGRTRMIKISGPPTEAFFDGHGNIHSVCWIDDSDLFDKNLRGLAQPDIPIQGLALFDWPKEGRPQSLNEADLKAMRFTITITDAEGQSFISEALQPKFDASNESVQERIVRFNRGTRDLGSFTIWDFTVPHGITHPPF
jgi:hypothetical protein